MKKYTLDAQGKKVGRIASQAATLLMGKNTPEFVRNAAPEVEVEIINASKVDITLKKLDKELHPTYSGYPSGIKIQTVAEVLGKKGHKELFRQAVLGMLPHNKLRAKMIKHLTIKE
ncbi:MAG: uL13 family ribosomal protein [bacterium]|nr:uL13 family ribosomal protein [bacterium]